MNSDDTANLRILPRAEDISPTPLRLRQILPLRSGSRIRPGEKRTIAARPQVQSCWPTRLLIKHPERWQIHAVGTHEHPVCGELTPFTS